MHEISLCQSMLRVVEEYAAAHHVSRVKGVFLEVGALAGVEIEALRFGFDAVVKGSVAEGARLEIIELQAQGWCDHCACTVAITQRFDICPGCGGLLQLTTGDELRIKELEVV